MRPTCFLATSLLAIGIAACTSGGGTGDPVQERGSIDQTRTAYVSAWRAADAPAIAALYADDALVLYPNQPGVVGKAAILEYFTGFFNDFVQEDFALTSSEIEVMGEWAFDRGSYRWRGVPRAGGEAVEDQGKYLVILSRQSDGSWKVARDMDNSDLPLSQATRGGA